MEPPACAGTLPMCDVAKRGLPFSHAHLRFGMPRRETRLSGLNTSPLETYNKNTAQQIDIPPHPVLAFPLFVGGFYQSERRR